MQDEGFPLRESSPLSPEHQAALAAIHRVGRGPRWTKAAINFVATGITAAFGGVTSFIVGMAGGAVGFATSIMGDAAQEATNSLLAACQQEQAESIAELRVTLNRILLSINASDEQFAARMETPEYVQLIRKAFTGWSRGQSEEKRDMVRRLLSHAADVTAPEYGLFNLFFDWVNRYNELHFRFIRSLREQGTATKLEIWQGMGGTRVRDDSAEADVFACIYHELNLGHIVRLAGMRDGSGRKLKSTNRTRNTTPYMQSVLDNAKKHELTAVADLFIHYAMDDIIPKLSQSPPPP